MPDDTAIQAALVELFSVANAPLTPPQRVQRAKPVFESLGMTIADVLKAMRSPQLAWNEQRAKTLGVSGDIWQQALSAGGLDDVSDLADLMDTMHRAAAASAMLRAGYTASKDAAGKLTWTR